MSDRARNYATVVYPESAPEDWRERLSEQLVPALISPVHDRDLDDLGNTKKMHYHVMILFSGVKTRDQAIELFKEIGGVGCEKVNCARSYARYLIHMDNPDKAQYDRHDIIEMCGADFDSLTAVPEDRYRYISEIVDFCCENEMVSFSELVEYSRTCNWVWFKVLCDHSMMVREYLRSRVWTSNYYDQSRRVG